MDVLFLTIFDIAVCDVVRTDYIAGFNGYRDYVTVLTGLLTLIIGATGVGAFLSFKKFRAEEQKVLDSLEEEKDKIIDRRNQLDMFLKIEEARNISESEGAYSSAIKLFDDAEKDFSKNYMLYILRGETYSFRGKTGDFQNAITDFELAIKLNGNSSRAWFGLGRAQYRCQLSKCVMTQNGKQFIAAGVSASMLKISRDDILLRKNADIKNAIANIEKSISLQHSEASARMELGDIYKSIGDNHRALDEYKLAYESNNDYAACGVKFALLWLSVNDGENLKEAKQSGIIDILKKASVDDVFNSKAAYALLWFILEQYSHFGEAGDAEKARSMTDSVVINQIFEMRLG